MAKICFMSEGLTDPGDPVVEKPLLWCIEALHLQKEDWWANLNAKFTGERKPEVPSYTKLRWVVIRVEEDETNREWKPGFYFSPLMQVERVKQLIS